MINKKEFVDVPMEQNGMDMDVLHYSVIMDKFGIPLHTHVCVQVVV